MLRFLWRFHPHESSPRKKSSRMWLLQEETLCTLLRLSHVLTSYPITCLDPRLAGWIRASVDWAIKKYLGMGMMKWWTMTLRGSLPDKSKMGRKMRIFRGFLCFFNGFDGFQSGRWRISRFFMGRKRTREVEGWLGYLLHDVDMSKYVLYIWYTSANGQLNREHDCKTNTSGFPQFSRQCLELGSFSPLLGSAGFRFGGQRHAPGDILYCGYAPSINCYWTLWLRRVPRFPTWQMAMGQN